MTGKPEKITAGQFELTKHLDDTYILTHRKEGKALASWSEFQQLARGILKDEIDELKRDLEKAEYWRDYWNNVAKR